MMNWADAKMIKGSHLRTRRHYGIQRNQRGGVAPLPTDSTIAFGG
jgi:hypothetical protein